MYALTKEQYKRMFGDSTTYVPTDSFVAPNGSSRLLVAPRWLLMAPRRLLLAPWWLLLAPRRLLLAPLWLLLTHW